MEENNLKKEQASEEGTNSLPSIDTTLEEVFLIFRDRYEYQPIYFIPKKNEGVMSDKIFVVGEAKDSSDAIIVSESSLPNFKRLSVKEIMSSYKLALTHHIAKLERAFLSKDKN